MTETRWLMPWVKEIAGHIHEKLSSPDPLFGPEELTIQPPFGSGEK
jgi:hypothetical protein